ncbi:MAG: DUF421 domain-containing protein [Vicinamibacterales bacterium]
MWFNGWQSIGRTLLAGVVIYALLVVLLRITGKRTLSKMNAFDFIVTVALGSTLASVLTSRSVPIADGVAALAVLVALQFAISWTAVRSPWVEGVIKSTPTLLVYRGAVRDDALLRQRVSTEEVEAAVRSAGLAAVADAGAVVLETDGSFSVIPASALPPHEPRALRDLE